VPYAANGAHWNCAELHETRTRIYRLKGTWRLANMVKPNYLPVVLGNYSRFGDEVALNGNGQTLIVGQKYESSPTQGIGGEWAIEGASRSGAVWLY